MSTHGAPPPLSIVTTLKFGTEGPAAKSAMARQSAYGPIQRPATRPYFAPAAQMECTEKSVSGDGWSWNSRKMLCKHSLACPAELWLSASLSDGG
jgi:hypothetical protein